MPSKPTRIHIGSCSDTHEEQPLWRQLQKRNADAFFWGGDIVYGDRFSPEVERLPATYRAAQELLGALRGDELAVAREVEGGGGGGDASSAPRRRG